MTERATDELEREAIAIVEELRERGRSLAFPADSAHCSDACSAIRSLAESARAVERDNPR